MPGLLHDNLVILSKMILLAPALALFPLLIALPSKHLLESLQKRAGLLGWATRLLSGVSLVCSILVALGPETEFPLTFNFIVTFYLDQLSVYFVLLVNLVAFFASWYTVDFLQFDARHGRYYEPAYFHFFFNAFHLTMLLVPMVDSLVILWMAIELTTLASTLLVRYYRKRPTLEAAWKYIIITTAGIIFALFGTILLTDAINRDTCIVIAGQHPDSKSPPPLHPLSGYSETICDEVGDGLLHWSNLAKPRVAETLKRDLVAVSFIFILVGYGTKAGFAPMHTWLPDGHGESPAPVSALLSGVLLKSALYAILRFYTITNLNRQDGTAFTSSIFLFSGLLSLIVATPFILKRNKFKRVLAYHSLEHMGIIAFGIGVGGSVALFGALLHALNHALTKALMFLTFSNVGREYVSKGSGSLTGDESVGGVLKGMPISGLVLSFGGLGLVGSPPFNIFLSEFIIIWAAFDRIANPSGAGGLSKGFYILAVVLFLATLTLIFGGLVAHLSRLLLGRPPVSNLRDNYAQLVPLLILLAIIILFGFWIPTTPVDFPRLLGHSVDILQGGAR